MRIMQNRFLKRLGCLFCLVPFLFAAQVVAVPPGSEGGVPTNFGLLERVSEMAVDELIANMPRLPAGDLLRLAKDKSVGEVDFVFENILLRRMRDEGFRVALEVDSPSAESGSNPGYLFAYQMIKMSLAYPKISRSYWFGSKKVSRRAEIDIFAQVIDLGNGDVIWVGDTMKKTGDVVDYSLLKTVEDEQYEFTRPPRKELRWSKFLQPVVVSGIVVGLVYLFFSNQSNE